MTAKLERLQRALGYTFKEPALLTLALTHRSFGGRNNERLEFLGDSVLNFIIADYLFGRFEEAREGQLSRLRARMVKGVTLAEIAREFDLGEYLRLGSGEMKSGGFRRESILADALESIIGAIYLDAGFEVCADRVLNWFEARLQKLNLKDTQKDSKTRLQEYLQARQLNLPRYEVISVQGEAHAQTFHVRCEIDGLSDATEGTGSSRRVAEQKAAKQALLALGVDQ
ncbi:ribonuclease III [Hahella chejuensis KCTC 2396]|uniref:Ribonuclease 3 n=1 Tax=Hahella chejuensis (strain KCTC 2396) TaxID=349521 RepID=RNC_HAHCH|nr:ribonuclease III [Hahella chejuensis]Q2SL32.1 RecName: Full=Ribonuclease 3; AltName: Full=Ribonuclease III; Short=RNase III [Hahella chejuensis KCTC 2396]ABC28642.1 ribonuclease III [Hahella chejuensis KCTC 2396]